MNESAPSLLKLGERDRQFVSTFIDKKLIPAIESSSIEYEHFIGMWEEFERTNDQYSGPATIEHVRDEILFRVKRDLEASKKSFLEYTGTKLTSDWNAYINLFELALNWQEE